MKVNSIHKEEIATLIHKLKTGQATEEDKQILEEYWNNALTDTSILDEMSIDSSEKLKSEMFHFIQIRLGLEPKT